MRVVLGSMTLILGILASVVSAAPAEFQEPATSDSTSALPPPSLPAEPSSIASIEESFISGPTSSVSEVAASTSINPASGASSSKEGASFSPPETSSPPVSQSSSDSVSSSASRVLSAISSGVSSVAPTSTAPISASSSPNSSLSRATPVHPSTSSRSAPNMTPTLVPSSTGGSLSTTVVTASESTSVVVSTIPASSTSARASTSSNSEAPPAPTVGAEERQIYLEQHNSVREMFGSQPLVWSDDLQSKAQSYAERCELRHSDGANGPVGENLAAATGVFDVNAAVKLFVRDMDQFNTVDFSFSHFTQVVWKSTTQLGCGIALCDGMFPGRKGPATYHVCLYNPVGNVIGQEKENLPL